jgi:two-component system, OmpR family, sensor histidine kinase KdpD
LTVLACWQTQPKLSMPSVNNTSQSRRIDYLWAIVVCAATMLLTLPLAEHVLLTDVVMVFLLVVVLVAAWLGSGPAVLSAFICVAFFDFFYVPPRFTFDVADGRYLITFLVMLSVALVTGQLAARLRSNAHLAVAREAETRALYDLAKALSGASTTAQVANITNDFLSAHVAMKSALYLPRDDGTLACYPEHKGAHDHQEHVRAVLTHGQVMPVVAQESNYLPAMALPLSSPLTRGVLLVLGNEDGRVFSAPVRPLLEVVASLVGIAVERLHFDAGMRDAELRMKTERLRNALLAAVSHDLRTPLTVLVGQADALTLEGAGLPDAARVAAEAIRDQALRLSGQVGKLLDMARLQTGTVTLERAWQPLEEVVGSSLKAMEGVLAGREVNVDLSPDLPPIEIDAVLLERVLCNLLENAARYAPSGPVGISARRVENHVEVTVTDDGPGVPAGMEEHIFEMFARGHEAAVGSGSGIGLSICRAIVAAHGGTIAARNLSTGGLAISFTLPIGEMPHLDEDPDER